MYPSDVVAIQQGDQLAAKQQGASSLDKSGAVINLKAAFEHPLYNGAGKKQRFSDIFTLQPHLNDKLSRKSSSSSSLSSRHDRQNGKSDLGTRRLLVIFIRHFFCGNCQEYLCRLSTHPAMSSESLAQQNLSLVIIGCGAPSHIDSYRSLIDLPNSWQLYSDPTSELYRLLGMQRSLSLGNRAPKYIQRSLTGNMLRSVVQGVRRIPEGDVLGAGAWDVNGGEFLFELTEDAARAAEIERWESWRLTWCHRMLNSRDHTEIEDLLPAIRLPLAFPRTTTEPAVLPHLHVRTQSSPVILEEESSIDQKLVALPPIKRRSSLRKSLSIRRQSWMNKTSFLSRSLSLRVH